MKYETELAIGNMEACVEITFSRSDRIRATHWEPAEGGEIDLDNVEVTKVSGATYDLDRDEISDSWLQLLDDQAWDAVEDSPIIYDSLHDVANYYEDHDYED